MKKICVEIKNYNTKNNSQKQNWNNYYTEEYIVNYYIEKKFRLKI